MVWPSKMSSVSFLPVRAALFSADANVLSYPLRAVSRLQIGPLARRMPLSNNGLSND
jgi:hypothetical protein